VGVRVDGETNSNASNKVVMFNSGVGNVSVMGSCYNQV